MLGKNNHERLLKANAKDRYKAYKAGNHWVFACMTTLAIGAGVFFGSQTMVQAETVPEATTTDVTPASAATADNAQASSAATQDTTGQAASSAASSAATTAQSSAASSAVNSVASSATEMTASSAASSAAPAAYSTATSQASSSVASSATSDASTASSAAATTTASSAAPAANTADTTTSTAPTETGSVTPASSAAPATTVPTNLASNQVTIDTTNNTATIRGEVDDATLKNLKANLAANGPATINAVSDTPAMEMTNVGVRYYDTSTDDFSNYVGAVSFSAEAGATAENLRNQIQQLAPKGYTVSKIEMFTPPVLIANQQNVINVILTREIISDISLTIPSNLGDQVVLNVTGKVGDTVTVDVPAMEGYTPDKTTVQATINIKGEASTTETVNYTPNEMTADVTIPSNLGNKVVPNVTGKVGDIVTVTVPAVEGYTLDPTTVQATVNTDGTITTADTVTYTANKQTNINVDLVDQATGEVLNPLTFTGASGTQMTPVDQAKVKQAIDNLISSGFTLVTADYVLPTTFTDEDQSIAIKLNDERASSTITMNYVNKATGEIINSVPFIGKVGDGINWDAINSAIAALMGAGYTIVTDEGVVPVVFKEIDQTGTLYFNDDRITTTITINYVDNATGKVINSLTFTGKNGDDFLQGQRDTINAAAKTLTDGGYMLVMDKGDVPTGFGEIDKTGTLYFYYTANSVTADVTIPSNLGDKVVSNVTGKVGDTVTVKVPTVEGYTADKSTVQATVNADGTITTTETVTYQKNATAEPTVPTTKDDANKPGNGGTTTPTTSATADVATPTATTQPVIAAKQVKTTITPTVAAKTPATTLPQTGDQVEGDLTIAGLMILGSIGLLGATQLRKRKNGDSHEI